jgi:PRTRC genetic system protein A
MVAHYIEDVPEDCTKKIAYVMQGDGVYERRSNKLGTFTTRLAEVEVPGLHSNLEEGWELNVPKIPAALLGTTVAFFRQIYKKHSSEVFLQFFYDIEEDDYVVHCPKQTITMASVKYENDELFTDEGKILVFEIHSHGNMGAFFSGTDDHDEKADRFYGVIGNIESFFPDLKLRLSIGGHKIEVDVDDLFDLDEEMYHAESYPKDWVDRIKKEKIKVVRYGGRYGWPGQGGRQGGHAGHGHRVGPNRQLPMWDGVESSYDDEIGAMMREYYQSENYLTSQGDVWDDDEVEIVKPEDVKDEPGGFFVQEGDKLWKVENGEKVWYIQGGHKHVPGEEEELVDDDDDDSEGMGAYDPYNWRGKKF